MADFKTHTLGAALVSGVAATAMVMIGNNSLGAILGYFALGVVGGLLPDVDSDHSIPIRIAYNVISVFGALLVVFHLGEQYSLAELVILGVVTGLLIRYGVFSVFARFTVHRGLFHSIPAAIAAGLLTAWLASQLFAATPLTAWVCAVFVCGGCIVHLILDEMYSVNLLGMRIKRSFGTALKLGHLNQPVGTAALYLAVVLLYYACPPPDHLIRSLTDDRVYNTLAERLLPSEGWFRGLWPVVL